MKASPAKAEAPQRQPTASPASRQQQPSHALAGTFLDNRPAAVAQRQQQAQLNGSARVVQAQRLQASITGSPRMQQQGAAGPLPLPANNTGLPDALKAGVEHLSGHSLNDVRVHYNSAQPAQLQAHAYAQGTDIHIGPGQEEHLPHETWHVVQQKQGRVRATRQLKGVGVNDDAGLEKEADVMGARALQTAAAAAAGTATAHPAPGGIVQPKCVATPVVQLAQRYMRALKTTDNIDGEIASLRRVFAGEVTRQNEVNTWVDGFAGMPTVRFVPGKERYYSPVGYQLEVADGDGADVLANFSGDGNTNDIPKSLPAWKTAFDAVVNRLRPMGIATWNEVLADSGYVVTDGNISVPTATYLYQTLVTEFLESDAPDADKTAVVEAIKAEACIALAAHYGRAGQARFLGPGLDPAGLSDAERNPDIPYTESILSAKFAQVRAAWFHGNEGAYAATQAEEEAWRGENWQAAREASAIIVKNRLEAAGAAGIAVLRIGNAAPAPAVPAAEPLPAPE